MIKYFSRITMILSLLGITLFLFSKDAESLLQNSVLSFLITNVEPSSGALTSNFAPFDRFGNRLSSEDISLGNAPISTSLQTTGGGCNCADGSGIFRLTFEDVCQNRNYGFNDAALGADRRAIACRVFADLSVLLNPGGAILPNHVEVLIQASEGSGVDKLEDGTIAAATPVIFSGYDDGLVLDMAMRAIQTNANPYIGMNLFDPNINPFNSAHGLIRFDFENFNFFLNTNATDPVPGNLHDLYTVVLHESLHMLGLYSLIDAENNNLSKLADEGSPRVYSRYDTYIRTIGASTITSNGTPNYINYPTTVPYQVEVATNNLIQSPLCSADAEYRGNALLSQALYLPAPWNDSGLSHLNCDPQQGLGCALDNGYVMNSCGPVGYNQRHPAQEEVSILCDLGYQLSGTYGTESFAGVDIIARAGTLELDANGNYTFTPNPEFSGEATVIYDASDASGNSVSEDLNIQVEDYNGNTTYSNDNIHTGEVGQILTGSFLSNDYDPEGDDQDLVSVEIDSDGDGTIETIIPVAGNSIPVYSASVLVGNITIDPETGDYSWTPQAGFAGAVVIDYAASDGMSSASASLTINVVSTINTLITASDNQQSTHGFNLSGNVLSNDVTLNFPIKVTQLSVLDANGNLVTHVSNGTPVEVYGILDEMGSIPSSDYEGCASSECLAIGINDILLTPNTAQTGGTPLQVASGVFLSNDINTTGYVPNSFEMLEMNINVGTITDLGGGAGFNFLPSGLVVGWVTARYLPRCADGTVGEWAYIFIEVVPDGLCDLECPSTNDCNIICDGSFELVENIGYASHIDFRNSFNNSNVGVSPDLYGVSSNYTNNTLGGDFFCGGSYQNNTLSPQPGNGNIFLGMNSTIGNLEAYEFKLREELDVEKDYRLSFWVNTGCDVTVNAGFSLNKACPFSENINIWTALFNGNTVSCDNYDYNLSTILPINVLGTINNPGETPVWEQYEIDFSPNAEANYLMLYTDLPLDFFGNNFLFVDNIQLVEIPNPPVALSHEILDTPCPGEAINIPITVCSTEEVENDVTLDASFQAFNLSFINGGDFTDGVATLTNFNPSGNEFCQTVTLQLQINASTLLGSSFDVFIDSDGACLTTDDDYLISIEVQDINSNPNFSTSFDFTSCALTLTPEQTVGNHEWSLDGIIVSTDINPVITIVPGTYVIEHNLSQDGQCVTNIATENLDVEAVLLEDITHEIIDEAPLCPGDVVDVVFKYCFDSDPIEFTLDAQLPVGINLGTGGDFVNGSATLNNFIAEEGVFCQSVTLQVTIDETGTAGVSFPINMVISENCLINRPEFDFDLNVFDENLDAGFTFQIDEENCLLTLIPDDPANEHSWLIDGVEVSTETNPTLTVDPGVYSVAHIITGECSSLESDPQSVDMADCGVLSAFTCPCLEANAINIDAGEGMLLSTLIINGDMPVGGINNQCLAINGHLIIDEAANGGNGFYTFAQSEIRMQPGARITVQPGAALAVNNNSNPGVHGCEFLWQGIYLAPQAGLTNGGRLRLNTTRIEDAIHAVHLGSGSIFEMSFTTFNRNHIGIYMPPSPQLQYVVQPTFVNNGNFRCTDNLLPPYPGQVINTGSIGLAGIELNDCKYFQIGGGSIFGVRITDTNYGVIVRGAGVEMLNSRIHDLVTDISLPHSNTGILGDDGIWIRLKNNRFYNLQQGVHSVSSSLSASNNIVGEDLQGNRGNVRVGFHLRMGMGDVIRIVDQNECYTQSYGIFTSNTHAANKVIIDDNTFELLQPPMGVTNFDAIRLGDALESGINDDLQISRNQINLHHRGSGISLFGVNGVDIADNDINFLSTVEATGPGKLGINLYSSSDNYVYDNRIIGATPSHYQTGIYVYEGDRNKLCCNAVTNTYYGALFYGICEATLLRHTTFTGNSRGLQCNQNTRIGEQTAAGNMWDESSVWQAAHLSTNVNNVTQSRFFVAPPPGSSVWPDDVLVSAGNIDWFVEGAVALSCDDDLTDCEPPSLEQLTTNDQFTQKLMQGDFYYGAYPVTSDWEAKRVYYRSQRATNVEDRDNWIFESVSFYQQQESQNTDLHQLTSVAQQLEQAYAPDTDLSDIETRIYSLTEELQALDGTVVEGTSPGANYLAEREALFLQVEEMVVSSNDFKDLKRNELSAIVAQLLPQNSNIVTTGEAAAKQQAVNRWYLETIAQGMGDLPVATEEALREIAESCPIRYGSAVGRAQSLLINYGKSFTEPIDCQPAFNLQSNDPANHDSSLESISDRLHNQLNSKQPEQVTIYPNPSSGIFTVAWPTIDVETPRQIEVFDLRGKLLLTQPVYGEQSRLDATHLPPGLYWIKLKGVDSVISRRIIIQ